MVGTTFIATALLALSATVAAADKTFKFQVNTGKGVVYLKADGTSSSSAADAVSCSISGGYLACDGKGGPSFHGDMTPMVLVSGKGSSGWSLNGDAINWNDKKFSIYKGTNKIYAESCPHGHFPDHGTAKAA